MNYRERVQELPAPLPGRRPRGGEMTHRVEVLWERLEIPGAIVWLDEEPELTLFNRNDGSYSLLNEEASAIFRSIASGRSYHGTLEALTQTFRAGAELVTADLSGFLDEALARGLVVATGEES